MRRGDLIVAAYVLDLAAGDPEWMPHPVRWMGAGIVAGERALRAEGDGRERELVLGGVLTAGLVMASYGAAAGLIGLAYRVGRGWGMGMEVLLGWTCLAGRSLGFEARSVVQATEEGDLNRARERLARIVGRDTAALDAGEISRAVVETVAESLSDGVISPMFWMAVGGVPMAMAFKAVSTLDSMIGHADRRYLYFGRVAARADDLANLVPSRMTAMGIAGVAAAVPWADGGESWRVWRRDAGKHRSPNAGQPEAAMAGALRVRLGGVNFYHGERLEAAEMGGEFGPAMAGAARMAVRMAAAVTLMGVLVAAMVAPRGDRRR